MRKPKEKPKKKSKVTDGLIYEVNKALKDSVAISWREIIREMLMETSIEVWSNPPDSTEDVVCLHFFHKGVGELVKAHSLESLIDDYSDRTRSYLKDKYADITAEDIRAEAEDAIKIAESLERCAIRMRSLAFWAFPLTSPLSPSRPPPLQP